MAVLMDTRQLPCHESTEAIHAALNTATSPVRVTVAQGAQTLIEEWRLGAGANLLRSSTTDTLHLQRTAQHLRIDAPERLSLASSVRGTCWTRQPNWNGDSLLQLLDLTAEYETLWTGPNAAVAFQIDYADLGLPVDIVRAAAPLLPTSPLYELTMRHVRQLPTIAEQMTPGPALNMLGSAMTDIVRALIAAVTPDDTASRRAREQSLYTVLLAYIEQQLHDPNLTPARIAAAHNISRRQLYRLFEATNQTPAEAILSRRLDGARRELATRAAHHTLISATARRWGFIDPRHFARRFRAAYGLTPSEWVRHHLTDRQ
ncbi:helix-turn-helix transcriptional regulator [Micromonospora sp. D93]|uniref:helix-turn-helix transcriptional regulator n=1 Tax=Micromonospora sp. D93 TaxID=2824886 RepID=UPI001B3942E7|nr:helix-turn-helix transcriptional regulator [Micromonospora sp. D93]MBQ1017534.1 helix-turn-helix transcriptional regulator [Micromonospora sp. D93]